VVPGLEQARDPQTSQTVAGPYGQGPHFESPPRPRCWGLSIGVAGMLSQMRGLANAIGYELEPKRTRLERLWRWLPLTILPRSLRVIREPEQFFTDDPPRLIIACGRHSVAPSIWLKRRWGDRVVSVFIQDPLVDTSNFDFVVAPEHDGVRGKNVLSTRGALHHVNQDVLRAAARTELAVQLRDVSRNNVAVLLGGPNRYYGFAQSDVDQLTVHLATLAARHNVKLIIVPSRRTPERVCWLMQDRFGSDHDIWDGQGENPYLPALAVADQIVVTGDSVSMASEAAATGRPIYIAHLTERIPARRFRRFHESFRQAGITRSLDGRLQHWTYPILNETQAVADVIRERL